MRVKNEKSEIHSHVLCQAEKGCEWTYTKLKLHSHKTVGKQLYMRVQSAKCKNPLALRSVNSVKHASAFIQKQKSTRITQLKNVLHASAIIHPRKSTRTDGKTFHFLTTINDFHTSKRGRMG